MFKDLFDQIDNYFVDTEDFPAEPEQLLDVPYVPTDEAVVEAMLRLGQVNSKDLLYDLGSGDGRILITAAREQDTQGIGVDIDPQRIEDANEYARWYQVDHLVEFIEEDLFNIDFSAATVVTLYLLPSVNVQLRPQLLSQLRPGARIVSHAFDMGDWQPDVALKSGGTNIYKWVVPAKVSGIHEWEGPDGTPYRIELQQKYQKVTGNAWVAGRKAHLESATLAGNHLTLEIGKTGGAGGAGGGPLAGFTLIFANNKPRSIIAGGPAGIAGKPAG